MKPQSFCSPLCRRRDLHVHPAIPGDLAPRLEELAARDRIPYTVLLERMSRIVAQAVRERRKARRPWLQVDGIRNLSVDADVATDHALNVLRRDRRTVPLVVSWAIVSAKVVWLCERSSLQSVLSALESSSSPLA